MTSFAPGTPESVIREFNEKFYGNQGVRPKITPITPPPKPSADQRRYDNLASRINRSPSQQRLMDRLSKKLEKTSVEQRPRTALPVTELPRITDPVTELLPDLIPVDKFGPQIQPRQKISAAEAKKIANMQKSPYPTFPKMLTPQTVPTFTGEELAKKLNAKSSSEMPPYDPRTHAGLPPAQGAGLGSMPNYGTPAGGNTGSISTGYNTGAPATTSYQGGTTGGVPSGTPNIAAGTPANFFNTPTTPPPPGAVYKKGGAVKAKKMASGGMTAKASPARRGDGIAQRGKTKGRMV
jgi:hypothetical protein